MKMTTIQNKNRTGIYVQKSAGVATAGDGLAPQEAKSPATTFNKYKYYKNQAGRSNDNESQRPNASRLPERENSVVAEYNKYIFERNLKEKSHTFPTKIKGRSRLALNKEKCSRYKKSRLPEYCHELNLTRRERKVAKYYKPYELIARKTLHPKRLQRAVSPDENDDRPSTSKNFDNPESYNRRPTDKSSQNCDILFTSPGIKAGATEAYSSYSKEGISRVKHLKRQLKQDKNKLFQVARRRMGLKGYHIVDREPSEPRTEMVNTYERYPINILVVDMSHPFEAIPAENQMILVCAIETTIKDALAAEDYRKKLEIGPCVYKNNILHVPCISEHTSNFIRKKIYLYNKLWNEADLHVTFDKVYYKRYRILVNLPNYNLTSEEFFKIFGKQNGFRTEHWKLYYKKEPFFGFWILFGVDKQSYIRLKEKQLNKEIFFLFETIALEFMNKDDGDDDDEDSFSD